MFWSFHFRNKGLVSIFKKIRKKEPIINQRVAKSVRMDDDQYWSRKDQRIYLADVGSAWHRIMVTEGWILKTNLVHRWLG